MNRNGYHLLDITVTIIIPAAAAFRTRFTLHL
jgi:hypothetical protein